MTNLTPEHVVIPGPEPSQRNPEPINIALYKDG
jgi:hypothetical protein